MASKNVFQAFSRERFTIIWSILSHSKPTASSIGRLGYQVRYFRGNLSFHESNSNRFRRNGFKGAAGLGSSLALMGFFKKEEKLSEHDQVRRLVSEGIVAKENKDVRLASTKYHDALNLTTEFYNDSRITEKEYLNQRVFIYDQLANLTLETGKFKQSEELFIETMKLAIQLGMKENDNAMIEMAMKVAIIHRITGRKEMAAKGLLFCIHEQEKKLSSEEPTTSKGSASQILDAQQERASRENTKVLLGKAYQHYAHYFMQERDFKNAVVYSTKALDMASEALGPTDETTFVLINDLATCQIMLEKYEDAEKVLKDGIKKSRRLNSVLESAMCSNLGALYIRTNRLDEAESTCKRGLKVAEKHYDSFMMGPCQVCLKKLAEVRGENEPEEEEEK